MFQTLFALAMYCADPAAKFTTPNPSPAEVGHGLSADDAKSGWISLFDGKTTFGWTGAVVNGGAIAGGATTASFGPIEIRADCSSGGKLTVGEHSIEIASGKLQRKIDNDAPAPIQLGSGLQIRTLAIRPSGLNAIFNQKNLAGWKVIRHPNLPERRQTKWSVDNGAIHAIGGPGALESKEQFGDLVLQARIRTRAELVNGGLFFRSIPGDFMNGYEAQIFNACYNHDRAKPARYSTGAIDDRQLARRLVTNDKEPFVMTVIAVGSHLATWVNGQQMTDWTDDRAPHANPRRGLRTAAGTIQLQAHDPQTDLEFIDLQIARLESQDR